MRNQQLLLRDTRPPIGVRRKCGMEDEAEAFAIPRGAPHQWPDRRPVIGPGPILLGREGQGCALAHAEHCRDSRIKQVGGGDFRVREQLAQPQQSPEQSLAAPAAGPLHQPEIALDVEPGAQLVRAERGIVLAARQQEGDLDAVSGQRGGGGDGLLAIRVAVRPRPHQGIDQAHRPALTSS
jgi:hypothetical protein